MDQKIAVKISTPLWLHLRALPSKLLVGGPSSCKVIPVPAILALQLRKALMVDVCGLSSGGVSWGQGGGCTAGRGSYGTGDTGYKLLACCLAGIRAQGSDLRVPHTLFHTLCSTPQHTCKHVGRLVVDLRQLVP